MPKQTKFLITLTLLLAALAGTAPWTIPIISLRCAKLWARYKLRNLSPEECKNLNATPITITLPPANPALSLQSINLDSWLLKVPLTDSVTLRHHGVILTYPRFHVIVMPPFSLAPLDADARALHFKDAFAFKTAVGAARLDDIDFQPDSQSLKMHLILLAAKITAGNGLYNLFETFNGTGLSGFIAGTATPTRTYVVVYNLPASICCGLIFDDKSGLTLNDIHQFLSTFQLTSAPTPSPATATNRRD